MNACCASRLEPRSGLSLLTDRKKKWWSVNLLCIFMYFFYLFLTFKFQLFNCRLFFQSYVITNWKYSGFRPLSQYKTLGPYYKSSDTRIISIVRLHLFSELMMQVAKKCSCFHLISVESRTCSVLIGQCDVVWPDHVTGFSRHLLLGIILAVTCENCLFKTCLKVLLWFTAAPQMPNKCFNSLSVSWLSENTQFGGSIWSKNKLFEQNISAEVQCLTDTISFAFVSNLSSPEANERF